MVRAYSEIFRASPHTSGASFLVGTERSNSAAAPSGYSSSVLVKSRRSASRTQRPVEVGLEQNPMAIAERQQWRSRSRRKVIHDHLDLLGRVPGAGGGDRGLSRKPRTRRVGMPTVVLTEIVSEAGVVPEVAESAIHGWFFDAVQLTGPMLLRIRSVRWRTTQLRVEPGW